MSAGRSPDQQVDPAGTVVSKVCTSLQIPDLDARFELKVRSMLSWCFPMMYDDFARSVDVAGLRGRGLASVVTAIDFRRERGPAAVGAPMSTRVETRHVELSGAGLGRQATWLGFESSFIFTTPVGSGDRLRYRETLTEQPRCAGHGRVLLTLVRPFGSRADLLVTEIQDELRHLGLHSLNEPHPTVESLSEVPADFVEAPSRTVENRGIFGLQHTDVNQFVYTADYTTIMQDQVGLLVAESGLPVAEHGIDRITAVFKAPFAAGQSFAVRGRLFRQTDKTISLLGIHALGADGPMKRPAVFGRIEGTC